MFRTETMTAGHKDYTKVRTLYENAFPPEERIPIRLSLIHILIGGGIGIPPMLELAKALAEANARLDGSASAQAGAQPDGGFPEQDGGRAGLVQSILGYRDSQMLSLIHI